MANDINNFTCTGRCGRDAETRFSQGGTAIASWSFAVGKKRGDEEKPLWLNCLLFGRAAEALAKFIMKGRRLALTGEIQMNEWEDQSGNTRVKPELLVNQISFMDSGTQTTQYQQPAQQSQSGTQPPMPDGNEGIPF